MNQYKFSSSDIDNCDETRVSCVHEHQKVIALKVSRQVGKLTSPERGKHITVLFCMSANGHLIPSFFVSQKQRMSDRLMINALAKSVGVAQRLNEKQFLLEVVAIIRKIFAPHKKQTSFFWMDIAGTKP